MLPGTAHVIAWAYHNQHHGTALAGLATAARWDIDPAATVARGPFDLQSPAPGGTPL